MLRLLALAVAAVLCSGHGTHAAADMRSHYEVLKVAEINTDTLHPATHSNIDEQHWEPFP